MPCVAQQRAKHIVAVVVIGAVVVAVSDGVGEATGAGWRRCRVAGWLEYPAVCTTEQSVEACPGREKSVDQPIR